MRAVPYAAIAAGLWLTSLQAQQNPSFGSRVDVVAVDFFAVDNTGRPVPDLAAADLLLRVDGRAREIRSLSLVRVASPPESGDVVQRPLPLAFGSNLPDDAGRLVFLVFDHESIRPGDELPARSAAGRFLDRLAPQDRVAVVTLPYGTVESDLTTDHDRVRKALGFVIGRWSPVASGAVGSCNDPRGRAAFESLKALFEGIAHLDGPKVVVFVSQGVPAAAACPDRFYDVTRAAATARVHMYIIQPYMFLAAASAPGRVGSDGFLTAATSGFSDTGSLEDLASETGGEFFQLAGRADNVFARVVRESSAYYLLGFDVIASDRDGKRHKITLTTSRAEITIRARPEFSVAATTPPRKDKSKLTPAASPGTLLGDYSTHRELPLRIAAYVFRGSGANLKLVAVADSPGSIAPLSQAVFGLFDGKERHVADWSAAPAELARRSIVVSTMVRPGPYRLRVAAEDDAHRLGAADYEFSAALTKAGPFQISSLMVGELRAGNFEPTLVVSAETEVAGYFELYGAADGSARPEVAFELADGGDAPARAAVPATFTPTSQLDRWIVTGKISVAGLGAGDYLLRAAIRSQGRELGGVVRAFRRTRPGTSAVR